MRLCRRRSAAPQRKPCTLPGYPKRYPGVLLAGQAGSPRTLSEMPHLSSLHVAARLARRSAAGGERRLRCSRLDPSSVTLGEPEPSKTYPEAEIVQNVRLAVPQDLCADGSSEVVMPPLRVISPSQV